MQFGIYDHGDDSGLPLPDHSAARMEMVQAYEKAGFRSYHVAEHHCTPLGHAPSPAVYLAAVSQHTTRLRFGPLVFLLPTYHPLRLIEEIGMLDNMSGGRLELGYGRGVSPIEMGFYGVDMAKQQALSDEAFEVVMQGLTHDRLDHRGRFFTFDDVPMVQRPVQRPHPQLWYGTNTPESASRCAREGINMITLQAGEKMRRAVQSFIETHQELGRPRSELPFVGVGRHIVVADSDEEARAMAGPAFARWRAGFVKLWEERGKPNPFVAGFPKDWAALEATGQAIAGSPATVLGFLQRDQALGGYNYLLAQLAFGDLTVRQVRRSAELFGQEIMPALVAQAENASAV